MKELRLYDPEFYCEVTLRTDNGKFGFDLNDTDLRDQIYGVIAEAIERYGVAVFVFHFMSNHYHGVYGFSSAEQLVMFFAFLHGNLARLAHRTNGTKGHFWAPLRVNAVAKDAVSMGRRVRYIMGQAVKAGLVDHPGRFPGASSVDAMLYGTPLMGKRFNHTRRGRDAVRLVGGAKDDETYVRWIELPLTVPECWAELSPEELRRFYAGIAADLVGGGDGDAAESGDGQATRECLTPGIADDFSVAGPAAESEPRPEPEPSPDRSGSAAPEPAPEPESPAERPRAQPPKQRVPTRYAEDGSVYSQGPVKPKYVDGQRNGAAPRRLFAADPRLVGAYDKRYLASRIVYYVAKDGWRRDSKVGDPGLRGAAIELPSHMLLGTLPLRFGGESWAPKAVVPG